MSPSQTGNRGVPETIHLTERSFDETLTATRGLVMVDFWPSGAVHVGLSRRSSRSWPRPRTVG
jgi:hypothetical protein